MRSLSLLVLAGCSATLLPPPERVALNNANDALIPTGRLAGPALFENHLDQPFTVFLDFDGGEISAGGWSTDNAQSESTFIAVEDGTLPGLDPEPYGVSLEEMVADIVAGVEEDFAPASVRVVTEEPSGFYVRVYVGGTAAHLGREELPAGIAPFDEGNRNPNDVVFVFTETMAEYGYRPEHVAAVVSHEVGHSIGLRHIDADNAIMNPTACHCVADWGTGPITPEHESGEQDSLVTLLEVSTAAPTLLGTPIDLAGTIEGYWVLDSLGTVYAFGPAHFGELEVDDAIAITPTLTGEGYWIATASGDVTGFGDATEASPTTESIVDLEGSPDGGVWALSSSGTVEALAGAEHHGSLGGFFAAVPSTSLVAADTGYWIGADIGYIWGLGGAPFFLTHVNEGTIVDAFAYETGIVVLFDDGGGFSEGGASPFEGRIAPGVVAGAADPDGGGWVLRDDGTVEPREGALWLGEPRPLGL